MKQIRSEVFETNSSSCHSISFLSRETHIEDNYMDIDEDGYIHVKFGEYGWEVENYYDQIDKLSYLLTMALEIRGNNMWSSKKTRQEHIEDFMQTDDFKMINDAVADYVGCKGIIIDDSEGYVDHQSVHGNGISGYLYYCGCSIIEFIFGDVVVHTDNDNH